MVFKKNQKGSLVIVLAMITVILVVVGAAFFVWTRSKSKPTPEDKEISSKTEDNAPKTSEYVNKLFRLTTPSGWVKSQSSDTAVTFTKANYVFVIDANVVSAALGGPYSAMAQGALSAK